MSHDIVEAALLSRAGYSVEWDINPEGSYDGIPQDILSYARRDRRWCQGNFQHFWLIFGDKIKPWHRFYLANGILSYLTGPLIILLALSGFSRAAFQPGLADTVTVNAEFFIFLITFLALPKFLGLVRLILIREKLASTRRGLIGRCLREVASTILELLLTILASPTLFYLHLRFVTEILMGHVMPWNVQARKALKSVSWKEAASILWAPTVLGLVWGFLAISLTPNLLPELSFILVGWILSIPISVLTSSPVLGNSVATLGLFEPSWTQEEAAEIQQVSNAMTADFGCKVPGVAIIS